MGFLSDGVVFRDSDSLFSVELVLSEVVFGGNLLSEFAKDDVDDVLCCVKLICLHSLLHCGTPRSGF